MYKRLIAFLMFLSLVVLLAITQTTAPSKVGPAIVVVVFVLIYIFLTCTLTLLLLFINKIVSKHKSEPSNCDYCCAVNRTNSSRYICINYALCIVGSFVCSASETCEVRVEA